ncbi:unnamed protein product [Pedinophyceae sp. YPF-701]|nr:unnamed protein product [Pedinophyceae sp. YPF-701]
MDAAERQLILGGEAAALIATMRQNERWDAAGMEVDPLLGDLQRLRREAYRSDDAWRAEPYRCFAPFIEVVRAAEANSVITAVALRAVEKLLSFEFIDVQLPVASDAITEVVRGIMECKFESTGRSDDENILMRMLQALQACVRCQAGATLSDEGLLLVLRTCHQLGMNSVNESDILKHSCRQILFEIVSEVFSRIAMGAKAPSHALGPLGFLLALCEPPPPTAGGVQSPAAEETALLALELLDTALKLGGAALARDQEVVAWVLGPLFSKIVQVATQPEPSFLAWVCSMALTLYIHLGHTALLYLDTLLRGVLLPIARGESAASQAAQEAALEGVLDLLHQPCFATDIFASLDCRIERSNLFEQICLLLADVSHPVGSKPLGPIQLLAVEGLFAILGTLEACAEDGAEASASFGKRVPLIGRLMLERERAAADGAGGDGEWGGEYVDVWGVLNRDELVSVATLGRSAGEEAAPGPNADAGMEDLLLGCLLEKHIKNILQVAAEHFNKSPKQGLKYLQSVKLLPRTGDGEGPEAIPPAKVAVFLRKSLGLDQHQVGLQVGGAKPHQQELLRHFVALCDFRGLGVDDALRFFFDNFNPGGEAQVLDRVLKAFGEHYFALNGRSEERPDAMLVSAEQTSDLAYFMTVLNSIHHSANPSVKKMSRGDFVNVMRGTTAGDQYTTEYLEGIYDSVAAHAIRSTADMPEDARALTFSQLIQVRQEARSLRGKMLHTEPPACPFLDLLLNCAWGPALASMIVVLDSEVDGSAVEKALTGVRLIVRVATHFNLMEAVDAAVTSLCRLTSILDPRDAACIVKYGTDTSMQRVVETVFDLVHAYGDHLDVSWGPVVALILKLERAGIVQLGDVCNSAMEDGADAAERPAAPPQGADDGSADDGDGDGASAGEKLLPTGAPLHKDDSTGSGFMRSFQSLFTGRDDTSALLSSKEGQRARAAALQSAARLRLGELLADSKFLTRGSLAALCQALLAASGIQGRGDGMAPQGRKAAAASFGSAVAALQILIAVALRNRDRVQVVWPHLQAFLEGALRPADGGDGSVVASGGDGARLLLSRAVCGALQICRRLLCYKEGSEKYLTSALHSLLHMDPRDAWDQAHAIASELSLLLRTSARHIRSPNAWKPIQVLLNATARHPQAGPVVCHALAVLLSSSADEAARIATPMPLAGFQSLLAVVTAMMDSADSTEEAETALALLQDAGLWLCRNGRSQVASGEGFAADTPPSEREGALQHGFGALMGVVTDLCRAPDHRVREGAVKILLELTAAAGELSLGGGAWVDILQGHVLPLLEHLLASQRALPDGTRLLRAGVTALSRAVLHELGPLANDPGFPAVWSRALTLMESCMSLDSEEVSEAVPETLRNMLVVMARSQVLTPQWKEAQSGRDMWGLTWRLARSVSQSLTPELILQT